MPEFDTDPARGSRSRPNIAVWNSKIAMTALGNYDSLNNAFALTWYSKDGLNAWRENQGLHHLARSAAPLRVDESRIFAVAHCVADQGARTGSQAIAFSGRHRDRQLDVDLIGDFAVASGTPTLALTAIRPDRATFGYTLTDDWMRYMGTHGVFVDPGR